MPHPTLSEADAIKLIAVRLGSRDFAIDMMAVREIRGWTEPAPLPNAAPHLLGLIQLRGAVIPVVDLSGRLGFGRTQPCATSVIVVVTVASGIVGLLVDAVLDLLTLPRNDLQEISTASTGAAPPLIASTFVVDGRIVSVIRLENVTAMVTQDAA